MHDIISCELAGVFDNLVATRQVTLGLSTPHLSLPIDETLGIAIFKEPEISCRCLSELPAAVGGH
jgi:hypothetical protein